MTPVRGTKAMFLFNMKKNNNKQQYVIKCYISKIIKIIFSISSISFDHPKDVKRPVRDMSFQNMEGIGQ